MANKVSGLTALDQRSREIFNSLVETYLESGIPVGSRTISRALPVNLSPASVRNIMADLEESGLIYAPHTSAGRMPTQLGLRFFVDALMEGGGLTTDQRREIDNQIDRVDQAQRVEDVLAQASNVLSGLSHCAGVVLAPKLSVKLRHIEFVNLGASQALVVLVGEDGTVENRVIDVPPGMPLSTLTRASNYLNARFQGRQLSDVRKFVDEEVDLLERELDDVAARVVSAGLAVWSGPAESAERNLIVRGQANLIEDTTALEDLERIRQLFDDLENKRELIRLLGLAEDGEGVRIFIGSESNLFSMSGSSVVVSPFRDEQDNIVGVLGVIGPTRINYARIIPMVDYTAQVIGRLVS